ncbi:hypothetical protein JHK87_014529 [Glycine soja]|nr:hypothetical protein JHK87_014529 [Glycine soja]
MELLEDMFKEGLGGSQLERDATLKQAFEFQTVGAEFGEDCLLGEPLYNLTKALFSILARKDYSPVSLLAFVTLIG